VIQGLAKQTLTLLLPKSLFLIIIINIYKTRGRFGKWRILFILMPKKVKSG